MAEMPRDEMEAGAARIDPIALARGLDEAWNSHDVERVVGYFTDDAVLTFVPPPPPPARQVSRGREEIRDFVRALIPGFHVESRDYRVADSRVAWTAAIACDRFREARVDRAWGTVEGVIAGGRFSLLTVTLTAESAARLHAGRQGEPGPPG